MRDLAAHGIEVKLPPGWEGRLFKRAVAGQASAAEADGAPAPAGETTHAVLHVSTIALPVGVGDFASGAVEQLGRDDALIVLFEYDPASAAKPLFRLAGIPRRLDVDDFSPSVLQRAIRGQAGAQVFFHDAGRAFCLYVVLGSFNNRTSVVPAVNDVLASLTIDKPGASSTPAPDSTAPSTTAPPAGTEAPATATTSAPPTEPSTTAPATTTPSTTVPPTTVAPTTTTAPPKGP